MSEMVLRLPSSYVEVEREEMEYVDGGGTISITLSKSTIQWIVGTVGGAASSWAITAALDALGGSIATAIEVGTAGSGTLFVGAFILAWGGAASVLGGAIAGSVVGGLYTGGAQTVRLSNWMYPNFSHTF